jgi:hypothetical protein
MAPLWVKIGSPMPHVIVIAGPNGAGKSTAAPALLHGLLGIEHFVNADVIARSLSAFDPESVAIQAGRIMLERLRGLASPNEDFASRPPSPAAASPRGLPACGGSRAIAASSSTSGCLHRRSASPVWTNE